MRRRQTPSPRPAQSASTPIASTSGVALAVCGKSDRVGRAGVDGVVDIVGVVCAGDVGGGGVAGVVCGGVTGSGRAGVAGVAGGGVAGVVCCGVVGCGAGGSGVTGCGAVGCGAGTCGVCGSGVFTCGTVPSSPRCDCPVGVVGAALPETGVCSVPFSRPRSASFMSSALVSVAVVSTPSFDACASFIACSRG